MYGDPWKSTGGRGKEGKRKGTRRRMIKCLCMFVFVHQESFVRHAGFSSRQY